MEKLPERVLAFVRANPGRTDREITDAVVRKGALQQHVNQTCNRLRARGLLERRPRDDGKIGNYAVGAAGETPSPVSAEPQSAPAVEAEDVPYSELQWSPEIPFNERTVVRSVPCSAGVYRFFQKAEYPRYKGSTRVLKIGCSASDLRAELLNHFQRHAVANRLVRVRAQPGVVVTVSVAQTTSTTARVRERHLLQAFEDSHWDLPLLNSQRGYERGRDAHFRPA